MPEGLPTCERDGAVATVRFNRPERLNALDSEVIDALLVHLDQLADDRVIRAVILTGTGRGFSAGGDLQSLQRSASAAVAIDPETVERKVENMLRLTRVSALLREMPKVSIAAVNGPCAGAGLSLACAADLRIAASSAVFVTAFLSAGQTGDYGCTWFLPRLVGAGRARELFLLGDRVEAAQAERIGLVSRVVPDDELMAVVREIAERVAASAPLALAGLKANLNDADRLTLDEHLIEEARRFTANRDTRDSAEAAAAFLEKRAPVFEGR